MSDPFDLSDFEPATPLRGADAAPPPYLQGLNDVQRQAVEAVDGPVLVLAGAGTGKTRVLTTRLAHILHTGRARPYEVLAVTFTNKASRQMKERVESALQQPVESLWLGTFHAMGVRILRRHAELAGLKPNFTILDRDDQIRLMKQIIEAAGLDEKKAPARNLAAIIDRWKDQGHTPDRVTASDAGDFAFGKAQELYAAYQARLASLNAADFGDLLLHCLTIFRKHSDILAEYQQRFRYILVDEYQDANVAQYLWLRLLAQKHHNICCVGDDDQSIYGWRGAEVGNILRFEKDFDGARIIRLEQNYRSTPHILAAASGIIAKNESRMGKTLWTDVNEGEKVRVRGVWDGSEEARVVAEEVELLQSRKVSLDEIAILVRASFQTREFEERFLSLGMPYRVVGGQRFYENREIRDANAYLRVLVQPDDDLAFERIFNVPKRSLGTKALQTVQQYARQAGMSLTQAASEIVTTDEMRPQARRSLATLMENFDRWRKTRADLPHPDLVETILDESGYTAMWQADKDPKSPTRLENLKELIHALEEFENLDDYLEHVSLVMDNENSAGEEMVSLMTLHGAKGLEFDAVFLPGWEEGLFPHQRALDEGGTTALEEERRLAHVGLTRARKLATVTFAANRRVFNQWNANLPSRFVDELPADHVDVLSQAGVYEGDNSGGENRYIQETMDTAIPFNMPGDFGARKGRHRRSVNNDGMIIDGKAEHIDTDSSDSTFAAGGRVFHQKFGYGLILNVSGNRLEISFDKAGTKKVIDKFVESA
ncbi:MAG: UvrD-helicase domain-containing protein [Alphaproteobacteria bacterium]|nr:UvrD-helicase domain-containing protein [Alphaproteobacteria bacterium]MBT4086528.1 UvrD-helicase domain-containing protein [Alphaproteobacteria bacterium]MBT4545342.1 UvrD-helicase domain-containing protein [Alphaproteobacteria bacterium]MBT7745356.1 UvrD-helicase domain-containing protein [Alphaproteobacteria bacterium]